MRHCYAIHIDKQGKTKVIEEDIEVALEKQGTDLHPDTYFDQTDDDYFTLEISVPVKVR